MSEGLAVGDRAPAVEAPLVRPDGETESVALASLYEDRGLLLVFYTNDFSPDCIREWCSFRDYEWFANDERVDIVGVSKSRPWTHRMFIDRFDLGFPLYADTGLTVTRAFDVEYRLFKLLRRARRSCFLIDEDGEIRYTWLGEDRVDPTRDIPDLDELRAAIEDAFGEVEGETFGLDAPE